MYLDFYGLETQPFQLSADPQFFFGSSGHSRALAYMQYGLSQSDGFVVITGEVGAGKTTLVHYLLSEMDPDKYVACTIVFTQVSQDSLLTLFAEQLGVPHDYGADKGALLAAIDRRLKQLRSQGKRCILLVDEAQNLSFDALEGLRMLSNIDERGVALVQTFLLGQPQFRDTISHPSLLQLRQRVIASCHLAGLGLQETKEYIRHRLAIAGARHYPRITRVAMRRIHEYTEGVPRRINTFCSRLLVHGYLERKHVLRLGDVNSVATELDEEWRELSASGGTSGDRDPHKVNGAHGPVEATSNKLDGRPSALATPIGVPGATSEADWSTIIDQLSSVQPVDGRLRDPQLAAALLRLIRLLGATEDYRSSS